jgi:spermidine/putrescine transport system permease protein
MNTAHDQIFKYISLTAVWLWLSLFVLLPLTLIAITSFLTQDSSEMARLPLTLASYQNTLSPAYLPVLLRSLAMAAITTIICLLLGFPFAYIVAQSPMRWRGLLLTLIVVPFWVSSLIRAYAMIIIIKAHGFINTLLLALHFIDQPLQLLYTQTAVQIALVYNLLPFILLPLYANLERLDLTLVEAARDLGASRTRIFTNIILPHSKPGIISGVLMVFLPAMTLFYIPELLGGAKSLLLGNLIQTEFLTFGNWPKGAAISMMLVLITIMLLIPYWRNRPAKNKKMGL